MRKLFPAALISLTALALQASSVLACGGLVAPNGSVRLARATTFVAWHDGVEHYLTAFAYQGDVSDLGWIVPLPAVPTSIKEGGAWTLQRLEREVAPPPPRFAFALSAGAAASAQVIERAQVEALDITVIKGSGPEILEWCRQNGFALPSDTRDHLLKYAEASPIFMAARYDVARAKARHEFAGDGAPVLITMRVPHPWVPLEVLANDGQQVNADLFLLTDQRLTTGDESLLSPGSEGRQLPGALGFTVVKQEPMNPSLFHDLSTDRNMGWVPDAGYLTYLQLQAPAEEVDYDLGVTTSSRIQLVDFGTKPSGAAEGTAPTRFRGEGWLKSLVELGLLGGGMLALVLLGRAVLLRGGALAVPER